MDNNKTVPNFKLDDDKKLTINELNNADLTNLASLAQQYYRKPQALGGGGNSFEDYSIPTQLVSTGNGDYEISVAGSATSIQFTGDGKEKGTVDATGNVQVTMDVFADSIKATIVR